MARFPNCIDYCDDPARTALWLEIRERSDLREALIHVIESPIADPWTRSNAILRLGATGQPAYRFIRDRLERLPPDDPDAHEWVLAVGSGLGPWPDLVYETLAAQLTVPYRSEATIFILGNMGTDRARAILEETARTTGDRELQQSIWRALRSMDDHGRP
jgi:HEAT repeat protein